jgi:hypothetical protein
MNCCLFTLKSVKGAVFMSKKLKNRMSLSATALIALAGMLMSHGRLAAQIGKTDPQTTTRTELYFVDGRASLGEKGRLRCGVGSPIAMGPLGNPDGGGGMGELIKLDLSFGLVPVLQARPTVVEDMFRPREGSFGSFAVRSIFSKPTHETVSLIYFHGSITSGTVSQTRGGLSAFDLLGVTNFSGQACGVEGKYAAHRDARRYVRMTGTCGNDQEVSFQVSRRPPLGYAGEVYLQPIDIFAYGTFRGNISCGRTTDRSRVRTTLTTAR